MDEDITNSNLKEDLADLPLEDDFSKEEDLNGVLEEELALAKDLESDQPVKEGDVGHLELSVAKKPEVKKKSKFLPWLIIIPVLFLMLALGTAYWLFLQSQKENGNGNGEETAETENGNGEETETPVETEKPDIDFTEISDGLREIDDAVSDIDETTVLIDEAVNLNDDVPEL